MGFLLEKSFMNTLSCGDILAFLIDLVFDASFDPCLDLLEVYMFLAL